MPQSLIYILLLFALALPVLGAILLRVLGARLTLLQFYVAAGGMFTVVLLSVLALARSDVPNLQIGSLSVLLPASAPEDIGIAVPVANPPLSGATLEEPTAADAPTALAEARSTSQATAVGPTTGSLATPEPTQAPTAAPMQAATLMPTEAPTEAPTAAPTEAPTPEPPAPTEAPAAPAPSEPRKYTVQAGDTLRSIAEQFNVSVPALLEANKLTTAQADSLRVGQELTIPTP